MNTQTSQQPQPKRFADFGSKAPESRGFEGQRIEPHQLFGVEITVHRGTIGPSKIPGKEHTRCLTLQMTVDGVKRMGFFSSEYLIKQFLEREPEDFPFYTTIVRKENRSHQFT